jgi:hypothetical protein
MTVARADQLTFKANRERGRHGWLRLTPAYSVDLVAALVADCSAADRVLDPFCGSGTTALACAQAGTACDTLDINPFLVWLANAKCAAYPEAAIMAAQATLDAVLAQLDDAPAAAWVPPIKQIEKWWDAPTLHALAAIFGRLNDAALTQATRDLLRVIFCRALIETAAVDFGHQSMSFKRRGAGQPRPEPAVSDQICALFQRAASTVLHAAREPLRAELGRAWLGDARDLRAALPYDNYSVVITSPPYPNRMSYIRELRPYMYWLGYLDSGRAAGELDWRAIGGTWGCATSNLSRWTPDRACRVPHDGFAELVTRIGARSDLLGQYVARYFEDVVRHAQALATVLVAGARIQYVVGNSKFYDVVLPTEQLYAAIFRAQGFADVSVTPIRKRSSKRELFEFIVAARA